MTDNRLCPVCNKTFDECECDPEKDWGVKIGSKSEAAWKQIYDNAINSIDDMKKKIELNEICRDHAKKRMDEEHANFEKDNKS